MKKKVFLMFLSFFVMFFLCTFSAKAAELTPYVDGGVKISKECGYYEVGAKNFNDISCNIESGHYVYTVTDKPWYDVTNPRITVDLSKFGLNSQALYHGAYETIVIIFQITLKEMDDGYQEFYLVDDVDYKNNLAEPITAFEHGAGYQDGEYRRYEFYAEVPGKRFTSSRFTFGFSANGFGKNDWRFGNVKIQVCLSNEQRKITNLRWVTNAKVDDLWSSTNYILQEL